MMECCFHVEPQTKRENPLTAIIIIIIIWTRYYVRSACFQVLGYTRGMYEINTLINPCAMIRMYVLYCTRARNPVLKTRKVLRITRSRFYMFENNTASPWNESSYVRVFCRRIFKNSKLLCVYNDGTRVPVEKKLISKTLPMWFRSRKIFVAL